MSMEREHHPQFESKESEPKRVVVEIGPGPLSLIYKTHQDKERKFTYNKVENLFNWERGDFYVAVDLPPFRSVDTRGQEQEENMKRLRNDLEERLPDGIKGDIVYADATKLPFNDETVDVVFMANVLSGHIKDDKRMRAGLPSDKKVMTEKLGILSDVKRVLKEGGRVIIEETFAPAYKNVVNKTVEVLKKDEDWQLKEHDDIDEESLIIELTKKEGKTN